MKANLIALLSGLIFGFGLSLSRMVDPNKVIGFLDITGNWDPSLALVMAGALIVSTISFRFILKRPAPLLDKKFHITQNNRVDRKLLLGSAIFGIGWGMSGYCPGPAIAGLGLFNPDALIIIVAIYSGFYTQRWITSFRSKTNENKSVT